MSTPQAASAGADDPFARFVRAHLPTDSERAVFWVLAESEAMTWTVPAVARDARISDHYADQVLRRFASAGIVERVDDGRPRRYRWRAEMSYFHHHAAPVGTLDPVCGMPVPPDSAHRAVDDGGNDVAFCSVPCLVRWRHAHRR